MNFQTMLVAFPRRGPKKFIFAFLLAMTIVVFSVAALRAQEQSAAEPTQPKQEGKNAEHPRGPGQTIVHESNQAAGEEEKDETAQFKESAAVHLVARWTGLKLNYAYWLCVLLNFAVIGGVIFWAGRKFLPTAFLDRTTAIQKAMQEAQKASQEARARLAEIESRLARLDAEIGAMRDSAEREAASEEARIQAAAEEDGRKIVQSAEQEIAAAIKAARRELTAHAADLAVGLAQKQIHVDTATDQALVQSFVTASDGPAKGRR